jgi:hypothetical protein
MYTEQMLANKTLLSAPTITPPLPLGFNDSNEARTKAARITNPKIPNI